MKKSLTRMSRTWFDVIIRQELKVSRQNVGPLIEDG